MNRDLLRRWLTGVCGGVACVILTLVMAVSGKAATAQKVTITTANYRGGEAIQEALDLQKGSKPAYDSLTVEIKPGTYKITEALLVYGNTTIEATGATIQYTRSVNMEGSDGRLPLISNACSGKKGYTGSGNIAINGGTWDFQGKKGQVNYGITMEAIRFVHGSNYTLTNMTLQNLYKSHYLTIEGVENVKIENCTFKDCTAVNAKKEAIHIDCMHNDSMAPSNQDNTIYDDTICNNVTITGCTFDSVPRGVGTHIAVAGLYPSNINISNNTFRNITYEAIKAYHYKNVTIANNKITNAGLGIKAYLYADPAEDADEEGNSNYLPALKGTSTEGVPSNLNMVIRGNTIQNITNSKNGFGIHVAGNASRVVNGVTIESNVVSSTKLAGIYTNYAGSLTLTGNRVTSSGKTGVLIANCNNVNASSNTITNSKECGIISQFAKTVTVSGNSITNAAKHSIYMKKTTGAKVLSNTVQKDKKGGICADQGCDKVEISKNRVVSSGKNGIAVLSSPSAVVSGNQVLTTKNMGIYVTKSDNAKIKSNTVKNVKTTGIVAQSSKGIKVQKNTVQKAGKFGILFQKTSKSSGSGNKISGSADYGVLYANNSKNKKQNLKFKLLTVKKGKKAVTGRAIPKVKITVTVDKKSKTKKTKANGTFSVKTKKLKKGMKVKVQMTDSLGNVYSKTVKAK